MITLKINGQPATVEADPETPLLWVIRDHIGLTGTKFGCGKALCGACTVHLNGEAVRSCSIPLSEASGKSITTIEGLAKDGSTKDGLTKDGLSIVQQAWIEHDVAQCGYCQSGQIMSATALLAKNSSPTDADIDNAMSGNICRCGTYPRIRAAIHAAAQNINHR